MSGAVRQGSGRDKFISEKLEKALGSEWHGDAASGQHELVEMAVVGWGR